MGNRKRTDMRTAAWLRVIAAAIAVFAMLQQTPPAVSSSAGSPSPLQRVCHAITTHLSSQVERLDGVSGGSLSNFQFVTDACQSATTFPIFSDSGFVGSPVVTTDFLENVADDNNVSYATTKAQQVFSLTWDAATSTARVNITIVQQQFLRATVREVLVPEDTPMIIVSTRLAVVRPGAPFAPLHLAHLKWPLSDATASGSGGSVVIARDPDLLDNQLPTVFIPTPQDPGSLPAETLNIVHSLLGQPHLRVSSMAASAAAFRATARRVWQALDLLSQKELNTVTQRITRRTVANTPTQGPLGVLLQRTRVCAGGTWQPFGAQYAKCDDHIMEAVKGFVSKAADGTPCDGAFEVIEDSVLSHIAVDLFSSQDAVIAQGFRAQTVATIKCTSDVIRPGSSDSIVASFTMSSSNPTNSAWLLDYFTDISNRLVPLEMVQAWMPTVEAQVMGHLLYKPDATMPESKAPTTVHTFLPGNAITSMFPVGVALGDLELESSQAAVAHVTLVLETLMTQLQTGVPDVNTAVHEALKADKIADVVQDYVDHADHATVLGFWSWFQSQLSPRTLQLQPLLPPVNDENNLAAFGLSVRVSRTLAINSISSSSLAGLLADANAILDSFRPRAGIICGPLAANLINWSTNHVDDAEFQFSAQATAWVGLPVNDDTITVKALREHVAGFLRVSGSSSDDNEPHKFSFVHDLSTGDIGGRFITGSYSVSVDPGPLTDIQAAKLSCRSIATASTMPDATTMEQAVDLLAQKATAVATAPVQLSNWPPGALLRPIFDAISSAVAGQHLQEHKAAERVELAAQSTSSPVQGVTVVPTALVKDGKIRLTLSIEQLNTAIIPVDGSAWRGIVGTDRFETTVVLSYNIIVSMHGFTAEVLSFAATGATNLGGFVLPTQLGMQFNKPVTTSLTLNADMPKSFSVNLQLDVASEFGHPFSFHLSSSNLPSNDDSDQQQQQQRQQQQQQQRQQPVMFRIRNRPASQHVSPASVLDTIKSGILNMVPRALSNSLAFLLPPYENWAGDVSELTRTIDIITSPLSILPNPKPTIASTFSCLDKIKAQPPTGLNVTLHSPQNERVYVPLNNLRYSSLTAFTASINSNLHQRTEMRKWLKIELDPDSLVTQGTDNSDCAVFRAVPVTPGALTYVAIASTPDSIQQNFTLRGNLNPAPRPLFAHWDDLLSVIQAVLIPDSDLPKLQRLQVPAADVGVPADLDHVYPGMFDAIGFRFDASYAYQTAVDSPVNDTVSALGGLLTASLEGGRALAHLNATISAGLSFVFDCPPPRGGENITVYSSFSDEDTPTTTKVRAGANTFTLDIQGQMRTMRAGEEGTDAQGPSSVRIGRRQWTVAVTLEPGTVAQEAVQSALAQSLPEFLQPFVQVLLGRRTRRSQRDQIAIQVNRAFLDNGTVWVPDLVAISSSEVPWLKTSAFGLPLVQAMMSDARLRATGALRASADRAEVEAGILAVASDKIEGTTDIDIDIGLLSPPGSLIQRTPRSNRDRSNPTVIGWDTQSNNTSNHIPYEAAPDLVDDRHFAPHRRKRRMVQPFSSFTSVTRANSALRNEHMFFTHFDARVSLNTTFELSNITVGLRQVNVQTTDAALVLQLTGSFHLSTDFNVTDMTRRFEFDVDVRGEEDFVQAIRNVLLVNRSSLCQFAQRLLEPGDGVGAQAAGVRPLPFLTKSVSDWLGPYQLAAAQAVEALCDGGFNGDLQVLCTVLNEAFDQDVCVNSELRKHEVVIDLYIVLEEQSDSEQFIFDAKLFEPVQSLEEFSVGQATEGSLAVQTLIASNATLVIDISAPFPTLYIRRGNLQLTLDVKAMGNIEVYFGSMSVPLSSLNLDIGTPVNLTIAYGEHEDDQRMIRAIRSMEPKPPQPAAATAADDEGQQGEEDDQAEGQCWIWSTASMPEADPVNEFERRRRSTHTFPLDAGVMARRPHPSHQLLRRLRRTQASADDAGSEAGHREFGICLKGHAFLNAKVDIKIPALTRFLLQPGPDTFAFKADGCPRGLWPTISGILKAVFGFQNALADFGGISLALRLAWEQFLDFVFSLGGLLDGLKLPVLGDWWKDILRINLGELFDFTFLRKMWDFIEIGLRDLKFSGISFSFAEFEFEVLKLFTDALSFLLGPWAIEFPDIPSITLKEKRWPLNLKRSFTAKPDEIGFDFGDHGVLSADFECTQKVKFTWHIQVDLVFSGGIRFEFLHNPAVHVTVQMDTKDCSLSGAFLLGGFDMMATAFVRLGLTVIPPARTEDKMWDFEAAIEARFRGDMVAGFAGVFADLLDKSNDEAIRALPNVRADLDCAFECGSKGCSKGPTCQLTSPRLCVGSLLRTTLHRALSWVDNKFFKTVIEVVEFLQQEVDLSPVLDEMPLVDVLYVIVQNLCTDNCDFSEVYEMIAQVTYVVDLISTLRDIEDLLEDGSCNAITQELPDMLLDFRDDILEPKVMGPPPVKQLNFKSGDRLPRAKQEVVRKVWSDMTTQGSFGVRLSFLDNPVLNVVKMLLGQVVDLVEFTFPRLVIGIGVSWTIPIWSVPLVEIEPTFSFEIQAQPPPLIITTETAVTLLQTGDIGSTLGTVAIRTVDRATHKPINFLVARGSIGAYVRVSIGVYFAYVQGSFYLGLTLEAAVAIPDIYHTGRITIGDMYQLVKYNDGNVFKSLDRRYTLFLDAGFSLRACINLLFYRKCWTIVAWSHSFTLWERLDRARVFPIPTSGTGNINIGSSFSQPYRRRSVVRRCAGACVSMAQFTLSQARDTVTVAVKTPDDGVNEAPRTGSLPADGSCIRFTGSSHNSALKVRVVGVFRCVHVPALPGSHIEISQQSYGVSSSQAAHGASTTHISDSTTHTLVRRRRQALADTVFPRSVNATRRAPVQVFRITRSAVLPLFAAGIVFSDEGMDLPNRRRSVRMAGGRRESAVLSCTSLQLTDPLPQAHFIVTGTPCQTEALVSGTQTVGLYGHPGQINLRVIGQTKRFIMNLKASRIVLSSQYVMADGYETPFTKPPAELMVKGQASNDGSVEVLDVPQGMSMTFQGSRGILDVFVPDIQRVNGLLVIRGAATGSVNRLRIAARARRGETPYITVTSGLFSQNTSTGLRQVEHANINDKTLDLHVEDGATAETSLLSSERFAFAAVRSVAELGATATHRVTGCQDPTSAHRYTLEGPGNQQLIIGSGDLERFNCYIDVQGVQDSPSTDQNYTIIVDAGYDTRDLSWSFFNGGLRVASRESLASQQLHIAMQNIDHVYVRFGNKSNAVLFTEADNTADYVLNFESSGPVNRNTISFATLSRGVLVLGTVSLRIEKQGSLDHAPFSRIQASIVSLRDRSHESLEGRVVVTAGVDAASQHIVLHTDRCISPAAVGGEAGTPAEINAGLTEWVLMHAVARGFDPGFDMSHCHVYQGGRARVDVTLTRGEDSLYVHRFGLPVQAELLDGEDTFVYANANSSTSFDVNTGRGNDHVMVECEFASSRLDFGSNDDLDSFWLFANGVTPELLSSAEVRPVRSEDATSALSFVHQNGAVLHFYPWGREDSGQRKTRSLATHRAARSTLAASSVGSAMAWFPGNNTVIRVSFPDENRVVFIEPQSRCSYVVENLGAGSILRVGEQPNAQRRFSRDSSQKAATREGRSSGVFTDDSQGTPKDWQVISALQDLSAPATIQVIGQEKSNLTVCMIVPRQRDLRNVRTLRFDELDSGAARLSLGSNAMQVVNARHVALLAEGNARFELQSSISGVDLVVAAREPSNLIAQPDTVLQNPIQLYNVTASLPTAALLGAGRVIVSGDETGLVTALPSNNVTVEGGCLLVLHPADGQPLVPSPLSPWALAWAQMLLPPSTFERIADDPCFGLFPDSNHHLPISNVESTRITDVRRHFTTMAFSPAATVELRDTTPLSHVLLHEDHVSIDNGAYTVQFGSEPSRSAAQRQVRLMSPVLRNESAVVQLPAGADCSRSPQTLFETLYDSEHDLLHRHHIGLRTATGGMLSSSLTFPSSTQRLELDLSLLSMSGCLSSANVSLSGPFLTETSGAARVSDTARSKVSTESQSVQRPSARSTKEQTTTVPAVPAAAAGSSTLQGALLVTVGADRVRFDNSTTNHNFTVNLGPAHDMLQLGVVIEQGAVQVDFMSAPVAQWTEPLQLRVSDTAQAELMLPLNATLRLSQQEVCWHKNMSFVSHGEAVGTGWTDGALVNLAKDCSRLALERLSLLDHMSCVSPSDSDSKITAMVRLSTAHKLYCSIEGDMVRVGVGCQVSTASSHSSAQAWNTTWTVLFWVVLASHMVFVCRFALTFLRNVADGVVNAELGDNTLSHRSALASGTSVLYFGLIFAGCLLPIVEEGSSEQTRGFVLGVAEAVRSAGGIADSYVGNERASTANDMANAGVGLVGGGFVLAAVLQLRAVTQLRYRVVAVACVSELLCAVFLPWAVLNSAGNTVGVSCVLARPASNVTSSGMLGGAEVLLLLYHISIMGGIVLCMRSSTQRGCWGLMLTTAMAYALGVSALAVMPGPTSMVVLYFWWMGLTAVAVMVVCALLWPFQDFRQNGADGYVWDDEEPTGDHDNGNQRHHQHNNMPNQGPVVEHADVEDDDDHEEEDTQVENVFVEPDQQLSQRRSGTELQLFRHETEGTPQTGSSRHDSSGHAAGDSRTSSNSNPVSPAGDQTSNASSDDQPSDAISEHQPSDTLRRHQKLPLDSTPTNTDV
ncbi:hypothetical protein PTSG_02609 [Salpingoeca rosetta]|uniref:Uncharacterized protein n=1 Tax=Salpingoeca rosetta (strain ATCC 50818 / BSB-021) TaxID=946362 RepID=F2U2S9_SALR5|nr:uncharacterized protein PTSG_02609 [Salpingoeca rosetta]EGD81923.1 hypothetical protein PTSG_02609 [Salpingoeca rosetta]|eukprot:XP_004996106.1 hypothetical protein PTSG_02609 [Salpingoeca rosetta]